jgi:hypothetical protein
MQGRVALQKDLVRDFLFIRVIRESVVKKIVNQKRLDTLAVSPLKTRAPVSRSARVLFYEKTD